MFGFSFSSLPFRIFCFQDMYLHSSYSANFSVCLHFLTSFSVFRYQFFILSVCILYVLGLLQTTFILGIYQSNLFSSLSFIISGVIVCTHVCNIPLSSRCNKCLHLHKNSCHHIKQPRKLYNICSLRRNDSMFVAFSLLLLVTGIHGWRGSARDNCVMSIAMGTSLWLGDATISVTWAGRFISGLL